MTNLNKLGLQRTTPATAEERRASYEEWKDRINGVDSQAHYPGAVPEGPLDSRGLNAGAEQTITTWTGLRVDPQNMRPSDIDVRDIAHSLSRLCRYNGHTFGHLSVARHSLWVAERLRAWYPGNTTLELAGLLHDAGEAYLGDMVRPMKHSPAMQAFVDADNRLDVVIAHRFGLPWPQPVQVAHADTWVLKNRELGTHGARSTWIGNANQDEAEFAHRFRQLTGDAL